MSRETMSVVAPSSSSQPLELSDDVWGDIVCGKLATSSPSGMHLDIRGIGHCIANTKNRDVQFVCLGPINSGKSTILGSFLHKSSMLTCGIC